MNFQRLPSYLKYILFSRHRTGHGIHSPFVFKLVTTVLCSEKGKAVAAKVEKVRKELLADERILSFNDPGSGSSSGNARMAKISAIAARSPVPRKYGQLLAAMAEEFGGILIIELGTSVGISTMYMAEACRSARVVTVEGVPEIADIARANFENAGLTNITVINGLFDDVIPELEKNYACPGLVFIDGHHRKEPVIRYFERIAGMSGPSTVVIVDDINHSSEMAEAWEEIKKHKKVSVTIDLFRLGVCFFRDGIAHNNYVIRY